MRTTGTRHADIECCRLYGTAGQAQEGIDLYSLRRSSAKYRVLQCKRVEDFTPGKIKAAVEAFANGSWAGRSETFVLCTTESLRRTERTEEIERQRGFLRELGVAFETWDADELDVVLKGHPAIVNDFFGHAWAEEFCGTEAAQILRRRLDGVRVAELRAKLSLFYQHVFDAHDPGLPIEAEVIRALPLRERYIIPDIYQEQSSGVASEPQPRGGAGAEGTERTEREPDARTRVAARRYRQRRPLDDWLADAPRHVVVGGPGLGKSSLLRFLAIDLLDAEPRLTAVIKAHGNHLPVWVSFPYWTTLLEDRSRTASLPEVVQTWLHQWGEDRLWPLFEAALEDERLLLFVDGLDEYRNEDAARVALSLLHVFVEQRGCRVVATSRPTGFERLGGQSVGWCVGHLADFTAAQQRQYAFAWHEHRLRSLEGTRSGPPGGEVSLRAGQAADSLMGGLQSSADLRELAKTPLLLGLIIYLKTSNLPLPTNRLRAYGRLVEHLISTHPAIRRRAAMMTAADSPFCAADGAKAFAALAYRMQRDFPDGLVRGEQAEEIIREFLEDEDRGFALPRAEARPQAHALLDAGEANLGLLLTRAPQTLGFLHRVFQEYLAADYLAHAPLAEQRTAVAERSTDPRWREVLLGLLHLTQRQEDVAELVAVMRRAAAGEAPRYEVAPMLCEVAVGEFNCPIHLARELCLAAIAEIETGPWLRHRERLLRLVLAGLHSAKLRPVILPRLTSWFPARHSRYRLPAALSRGPHGPDLTDCLIRMLHDEESYTQGEASAAIGGLAREYPDLCDRHLPLARLPYPVAVQKAALETLFLGWPDHPRWPDIVGEIRESASVDLRLIAIRKRVQWNAQAEEDFNELLMRASGRGGSSWSHGGSIARLLVQGWPGHAGLKRAALEAIQPHYWREDGA
jgi:NACHT domain